jgi:hypothetical protein
MNGCICNNCQKQCYNGGIRKSTNNPKITISCPPSKFVPGVIYIQGKYGWSVFSKFRYSYDYQETYFNPRLVKKICPIKIHTNLHQKINNVVKRKDNLPNIVTHANLQQKTNNVVIRKDNLHNIVTHTNMPQKTNNVVKRKDNLPNIVTHANLQQKTNNVVIRKDNLPNIETDTNLHQKTNNVVKRKDDLHNIETLLLDEEQPSNFSILAAVCERARNEMSNF